MTGLSAFEREKIFHVHTSYTDGKNTVDEYIDFARKHQVTSLTFLEHLRRQPSYDPAQFACEIIERKRRCRDHLEIHLGFEIKVLPAGGLDIDDAWLLDPRVEVIGIAEHGFPGTPTEIATALNTAFKSFRSPAEMVWVHPGRFFEKSWGKKPRIDYYQRALDGVSPARIRIELNLHHELPVPSVAAELREYYPTVIGWDAHSVEEIRTRLRRLSSNSRT